ncbi:MAG: hypothetical protein ACRDRB_26185, partial [Pseudonocardiaceae bacterium]
RVLIRTPVPGQCGHDVQPAAATPADINRSGAREARHTASQQGTVLQLRGTSHHVVARTLQVTGLDRLFDIVPPDSQP